MLATSIKGWEEAGLARHEAGGQPVAQVLLADKALFAALTEAISRALISLRGIPFGTIPQGGER